VGAAVKLGYALSKGLKYTGTKDQDIPDKQRARVSFPTLI
jgi:hypothetical protein